MKSRRSYHQKDRYADVSVLIAEHESDIQSLLNTIVKESEKMELRLNGTKTETINMVSRRKVIVKVENYELRQGRKIQILFIF